jgi:hypothetical protein
MIVVAMLSILTFGDSFYMGMYVHSLFQLTMQIGRQKPMCEILFLSLWEVTFEFGIVDSCFVKTIC